MAISKEKAKELFDKGLISQTVYDSVPESGIFDAIPPEDAKMQQQIQAVVPPEAPAPMQPIPEPAGVPPAESVIPAPVVIQPVETSRRESTSTTQKERSAAEVQAEKDQVAAFEAQKKANESSAATAQAKAAEEFNLKQEQNKVAQEAAVKRDEAHQKGNEEYAARLDAIDKSVEDMKNQKYEGFWSKQETGNKIVGALAIAMGAYGASLGGGRNYALDIINKAADDDFAQYKQGIDQQISAINQSRLSLDNKEKLTQQKLAQLDAYSLAQTEQIKNKIESLGSKFAGQEAQDKLLSLNAQLDQSLAEKRMAIEDKYAKQVTTNVEKEIAQVQVDPTTGQVLPKINEELEIPGFGQARTKEEAKEFRQVVADTRSGVELLKQVKELGTDVSLLDREKIQKIDSLLNQAVGKLRISLTGGGPMTDEERDMIRGTIGDPSKLFSTEAIQKAKIDQLINNMEASLNTRANSIIKNRPQPTQKTITNRQYSPSRDQTKIIYSDGSTEIKSGRP